MLRDLLTISAIGLAVAVAGPAAAQSYGQSWGQQQQQPQYGQQQSSPYGNNQYGNQQQYGQPQYGNQQYGNQPYGQQNQYGQGGTTQGGAYNAPNQRDRQDRRQSRQDMALDVENALYARGYDVGQVDGDLDTKSRAAIRAYERDAGLPITGQPSQQLLAHIESNQVRAGGSASGSVGATAGQVIDRFLGGQQTGR